MKRLAALMAVVATACGIVVATSLAGDGKKAGFHTAVPKMLQGQNGATTQAIISVGDTVNGHTFDSIPDGISISKVNGKGTFDILINHELSPVPFGTAPGTTVPNTRQDYSNALVANLRLHQKSAGVLNGSYAIPSNPGYQRFCSNFIVGPEHGFARPLLFTNEEARDIVLRQQDSWHQPGVTLAEANAEQAGVVVAYDLKSRTYRSIYGMGRHNHENSVGVPGYGYPVVLSGDDTFDAPASQLYLYKAASGNAVWNDQGALYAFKSDNPAINDYGDVTAGMTVTGHFIEVPRMIATGKRADGKDVTSADFGYPSPPAGIPNGPQWVLEHWSNLNNVFQFIRIEDTAYDRNNPLVQYLADTGEPRAVPNPATGRLMRAPSGTQGPYPNGRLWKLELAPASAGGPLTAAKLSIAPNANFDALGYRTTAAVHNPDNLETTKKAVYIQEDPGSHQSQPAFPGATNARIWQYDIATGALKVVAEVDQSMSPVVNKGAWESSGIVDASAVLGPGAFLVDVQAHGWDTIVPGGNDAPAVQVREHGQLLVLRVPGEGVAAPPGIGKVNGKGKGNSGNDNDNRGKGKAKGRNG